MTLPHVRATRYVVPLREGGSLPGLVEADDLGIYVCKFRGAGQGVRVLVAEVVVGELARRLGIAVPELVTVELESAIARYEADEEVQDLLNASLGRNLGIDFLPGAFGFDSGCRPDAGEAARVLWLDALVANVDRSWRNPNLLMWHGRLWAIDHGACLYFHHSWPGGIGSAERFAAQPYSFDDHVLGGYVDRLPEVDAALAPLGDAGPASGRGRPGPRGVARAGARCRHGRGAGGVRRLPARSGQRPTRLGAGRWPMTGSMGFQYVVLRCVPRVDREEFVNVGVVLYSQEADFLDCRSHVDAARLGAMAPALDLQAVESALEAATAVCRGDASAGAAARAPLGTRFGFLSAPRSTVVQPGPIHGGTTDDPARHLEHLLDALVR